MKNLAKLIEAQEFKSYRETLNEITKIETLEASKLTWHLNNLLPPAKKRTTFKTLTELKSILVDRLNKRLKTRISEQLQRLTFAEDLQPVNEVTITVEWRKNRTWGNNPTAEAFVYGLGHLTSGSIGGCGYDKCSTAVAKVLNQIPQFQKLMFELKNKKHKVSNRELLGYGSGYGILPSFEGGVGVGCYDRIFNSIGYKFETISSGKTFDVYRVSKVTPKEQKRKSTKLYNYNN